MRPTREMDEQQSSIMLNKDQKLESDESQPGSKVFGQFLDNVRRRENLNRTQFARFLGISRQHLWVLENGRQGVTPQRAARFARRLGYTETTFVEAALQAMVQNAGLGYHVEVRREDTSNPESCWT